MAALSPAHWEATSPALRRMLGHLAGQPFLRPFYLGGGTAVALRLGHRRSHDLDFFSASDEVQAATRRAAVQALASFQPVVVEDVDGDLVVQVPGLHIAFLSYGYPLVEPADDLDGVPVASLTDLGLMKLDALIGRGSRKDFYDLYFLLQRVPLPRLLTMAESKYPSVGDFELMAMESLVMFENADRDVEPELLVDLAWPDVRAAFQRLARERGEGWW
jgi:predicted nucleotidyltransferase component of viral defense system